MDIDLKQGLGEIAGDAPTAHLDADSLWRQGVRRRNRRRAGVAAGVLTSIALVAGAVGVAATPGLLDRAEPPPAGAVEEAHLPDRVWRASPWTPGTERAGDPGRIAVMWWDNGRRQSLAPLDRDSGGGLMTVSAVDGSYRYLDLPGFEFDGVSVPALSPDGRFVAYALRSAGSDDPAAVTTGWAAYDAQTGRVVRHVPDDTPLGVGQGGLVWSPDSRTLLADVCRVTQVDRDSQSCTTTRADLWDVTTGRTVEVPGVLASEVVGALGGDLLVRGTGVRRLVSLDPATGTTEPVGRLASYAPGSELFRVAAVPSTGTATVAFSFLEEPDGSQALRVAEQPLDGDASPVPRDLVTGAAAVRPLAAGPDGRVVALTIAENGGTTVDRFGPQVGEEERLVDLRGFGGALPQVATGLADEPTVPGVRPPEVRDPRLVSGGVALGLAALVGAGLVWRRRRSAA